VVATAAIGAAAQALGASLPLTVQVAVLTAVAAVGVLAPDALERLRLRAEGEDALLDQLYQPSRTSQLPLVRDVSDPQLLGASKAAVSRGTAVSPPYVPRTRDVDLRRALLQERFVLVVGDSKAGKTRSCFEAVRALFPDRVLLIPRDAGSVAALPAIAAGASAAVVWLDDLERYLGTDRLTEHVVQDLIAGGAVTVVATMRVSQVNRYAPRLDDDRQDVDDPAWNVIQRAYQVHLDRRLDLVEHRSVQQVLGIDSQSEPVRRHGLAAYLAAGPDLWARYVNSPADNPVGPALVRAAVAWRWTGLDRPVPTRVLKTLYADCLHPDDRVPENLTRAAFRRGLAWATEPIHRANALLTESPAGVSAFDYIVDQLDWPEETLFPDALWDHALQAASHDYTDLFRIGNTASDWGPFDVAERALTQIAQSTSDLAPSAANNLGALLVEMARNEDDDQALRLYHRARGAYDQAIASGHPNAAPTACTNLGHLLTITDDRAGARTAYQRAIDSAHPDQRPRAWRHLGYRLIAWGRRQTRPRPSAKRSARSTGPRPRRP
jgi:tetratricopeptide (TPR) repeat protein